MKQTQLIIQRRVILVELRDAQLVTTLIDNFELKSLQQHVNKTLSLASRTQSTYTNFSLIFSSIKLSHEVFFI